MMENLKKGDIKNFTLPIAMRSGTYINEHLIIKDRSNIQIWKHLEENKFEFVSDNCGFVDISNFAKINVKPDKTKNN